MISWHNRRKIVLHEWYKDGMEFHQNEAEESLELG